MLRPSWKLISSLLPAKTVQNLIYVILELENSIINIPSSPILYDD